MSRVYRSNAWRRRWALRNRITGVALAALAATIAALVAYLANAR